MIEILETLPFGFVMELQNTNPYFSQEEYKLYLNNQMYGVYNKNVVSVFGLKPETRYQAEIKISKETFRFEVETKKLGYLININDYNAAGDGKQNDTSAINTAVYTAPQGAVVYIPKGTYLVDQIYLKSDVDVYLEKGSCIKQNIRRESLSVLKGYQKDYHHADAAVNASWEGNPLDTYCGIFFGYEVNSSKIYGEGCVDGSGAEGGWWNLPKKKQVAYRPKNIFLNHCSNLTLIGITSRNSASWNVHPFYCKDIRFYDLHLESEKTSPNTDGINPESCTDVVIKGCRFEVGDDCIAVKSGKYFMSRFEYQPCENLYVRNCYMGNGHGAIALGSEISCGVRNLLVEQCYMDGTDRGIRIKTRRGRGSGSILDQIKLRNLKMNHVRHCLSINMFYNCDPDGKGDYVKNKEVTRKDEMTPEIRNIEISGIEANDITGCAVFLYGLPESKIGKVIIKESRFGFSKQRNNEEPEMLEDFETIPDLGIFIKNVKDVIIQETEFVGEYVSIFEKEEERGTY